MLKLDSCLDSLGGGLPPGGRYQTLYDSFSWTFLQRDYISERNLSDSYPYSSIPVGGPPSDMSGDITTVAAREQKSGPEMEEVPRMAAAVGAESAERGSGGKLSGPAVLGPA